MDWLALFSHLSGRIGRRSFWVGFTAALAVFWLVDLVIRGWPGLLKLALWAAFFYPVIAVIVKRLHDRGRTGWWGLLLLTPIAGALLSAFIARLTGAGEAGIQIVANSGFMGVAGIVLAAIIVELGLRPSDPGFSKHGPPPLQ